MWQIISGALLLSLVHAAIPNHWLPIVTVGKAEKWSMNETLRATILIGAAHIASTILFGVLIGIAGLQLSARYAEFSHIVAPAILAILGLIYIGADLMRGGHHHHDNFEATGKHTKAAIISSMVVAMFFSPCVELDVYFLPAGALGAIAIAMVSVVYLITTILMMTILVYVATKGLNRLNWHALEHHERLLTGTILVILAIATFFME